MVDGQHGCFVESSLLNVDVFGFCVVGRRRYWEGELVAMKDPNHKLEELSLEDLNPYDIWDWRL